MDASEDLDLEGNDSATSSRGSSQAVKKNIQLKLSKPAASRGRPKGRKGRGKKVVAPVKDEDTPPPPPPVETGLTAEVNIMDEEVELVTMKSALPVEPKHNNEKLNWNHKVMLIGEKVMDPFIYCCDMCTLPILIYGRMIPCKHVFCFDCAKKTDKNCPRCNDAVSRIEQSALGTVFVCMHGGSKHGSKGCRRTYLSHRDLQAHIAYRHAGGSTSSHVQSSGSSHSQQQDLRPATANSQAEFNAQALVQALQKQTQQQQQQQQQLASSQPPPGPPLADTRNPPPSLSGMMFQQQSHLLQQPPPQALHPSALPMNLFQGPPPVQGPPPPTTIESYHTIPVMSSRRDNLINVQMQDEQSGYQRPPTANYSQPPPGYTGPSPAFPPAAGPPPPQYTNPAVSVPFSGSMPPPGTITHPPPNMSAPPPIVGANLSQPPPPIPPTGPMGGPPPPRYQSPHTHYEGGHSPRTAWTGGARGPPPPTSGPPPQRGPPPPRGPTSTGAMGIPPPRPYFQQ